MEQSEKTLCKSRVLVVRCRSNKKEIKRRNNPALEALNSWHEFWKLKSNRRWASGSVVEIIMGRQLWPGELFIIRLFDYEAKYLDETTDRVIPGFIQRWNEEIQLQKSYMLKVNCKGFARVIFYGIGDEKNACRNK